MKKIAATIFIAFSFLISAISFADNSSGNSIPAFVESGQNHVEIFPGHQENKGFLQLAYNDVGSCMSACASEQGICIGQCQGNGQCIGECAATHGRCVARCN